MEHETPKSSNRLSCRDPKTQAFCDELEELLEKSRHEIENRLAGTFRSALFTPQDIEDVLQDACLEAFEKGLRGEQEIANLKGFICFIAKSRLLTRHSNKHRQRQVYAELARASNGSYRLEDSMAARDILEKLSSSDVANDVTSLAEYEDGDDDLPVSGSVRQRAHKSRERLRRELERWK